MKRSLTAVLGATAAISLVLTGCSGADDEGSAGGPQTLTLAGWSFATTPEFKTLADGFHAAHPDVTVELKEYDAANYDTQMVADLAAGKAPDIYAQKTLKNFYTYQNGKQLVDVSDVASGLAKTVGGIDSYQADGKTWAVPYRQDSWVLFYNKTLFDKAGVKLPDGSWTWDDYAATAKELTAKLNGPKGDYEHIWQSTVQGFALAQTPGAAIESGDFGYLKPYYSRVLDLQNAGAQVKFGDATTNNLTYQSQFGKQSAAMMLMGSWYIATLRKQQGSGEADKFDWGFAPAPQLDKSTTGTSATPVTFGDPTGLGINPKINKGKLASAKAFLAYAAGVDGAKALAGIGITPADTEAVRDTFFKLDGVPQDDLSKFAFTKHETKPENPVSKHTAALQNVLSDTHTAIMSGSKDVGAAITEAQNRAKNEVLNK
ncbi:extracellular solute-binding protein [Paractinoplanes ferrugineus]|uniref:Sugar ABC transporter substrate-binding protein n=1 Tax=Paractinoplanes ferrugineus TaxID=113564 RepID=A0A919IZY0_9ACTN|nr:extracellular solute-binding protein [Actinoplanes ferrugineus]GIE10962.1 sugar ABC transporter substrate-binding protein [Actinoplanes ferrugineus]